MTIHHVKFLIIKSTRCTNFSNLFLEWNSTCFKKFLCQSSGVFHCTHSNGICHTGLLTACKQDQDVPSWSCLQVISTPVWHIPLLCVQWKTSDDGWRNCPKHVDFHSNNKFWEISASSWFYYKKCISQLVSQFWALGWTAMESSFNYHEGLSLAEADTTKPFLLSAHGP